MKSTTTKKWISTILAVLLIFGCCAVAFADLASAGSGSMSDNYETYFTKVHEIAEFPDADGKYTLRDGVIYLDGFYMGWSDDPAKRTVLDDVPFYNDCDVALFRPTNSYIYFVEKDGRDIRRLDLATMRVRTIYEGETPISELEGDDNCLFFRAEDRLYRMYVKTGEAREVMRIPAYGNYGSFVVWDDERLELIYWPEDGEVSTALPGIMTEHPAEMNRAGGFAYMLNCNTGVLHGESSDEFYALRANLGEEIYISPDDFESLSTVDTHALPNEWIRIKLASFYRSYPDQSFYTNSYGGATHCVAFAKNAYAILYDRSSSAVFRAQTERKFFNTDYTGSTPWLYTVRKPIDLTYAIAKSIPAGAHVRVHAPAGQMGTEVGHSIIIVGRSKETITIYHSNWKYTSSEASDRVRVEKLTFSKFIDIFETIFYYDSPSANSSHIHNRSKCFGLNDDIHRYYCSECYDESDPEAHTWSYIEGYPTQYYCTKCHYEKWVY